MWITQDQAVVMFARYCRARFGTAARKQVTEKAKALKKRGDVAGCDAWTKVAEELDKGTKSRSRATVLN